MAEQVLEDILTADPATIDNFPQWFMNIFEDYLNRCSIEEFAIFFLSLIRSQTEEFTKYNSSTCNTPKKLYATPTTRKLSLTNVEQRAEDAGSNGSKKTISRDLFVQKKCNESVDDFHNDFSKIDDRDLNKRDDNSIASASKNNNHSDSVELEMHYERNENESKYSLSRRNINNSNENESDLLYHNNNGKKLDKSLNNNCNETTFTPILTHQNYSTPIKATNKSLLNTSTPIMHSGNKSNKSSRNSSYDRSANDSKKSYERSFNNNTNTSRRQTSSPCLGDFINYQLKTKRKSTNSSKNDSIFSENDFPNLNDSGVQTPPTETKPKKRVAPITISKTTTNRHDFSSSSFKSDNNLLNVNNSEDEHKDERGLLRSFKEIIRNSFDMHSHSDAPPTNKILQAAIKNTMETPQKSTDPHFFPLPSSPIITAFQPPPPVKIELSKVTSKMLINRIVDIYSLIIDLNLTPNVLTDISYLINLINTEYDPYADNNNSHHPTATTPIEIDIDPKLINHTSINTNYSDHYYSVLKNLNNCVYFSLQTLEKQKALLALLDNTTIKVLIDNERLTNLNQNLHSFLREIHAFKSQMDSSGHNLFDTSLNLGNNSINNVFYQQENDTKDNFPSDREFGAFKKQRDSFYNILRTWEFKHLNPAWNFLTELGGKVRSLLSVLEHPINMAHLAKLFTAQLIISCNFDNSTSELQMVLPNVDLTKLSKLRQRLIAPSIFSTQYLFPGNQAFFRDFIVASEHNVLFIEQLKIVLIHELREMNDSSYEVLNVSNSETQSDNEYVVRPESTSTMRVLAKFIGYVVARPFNYDSYKNAIVDNRQIELRNSLFPVFDIKTILLQSISEKKLIITIPWLVQYIAMLDTISLRLNYYKEVFSILYELYISTNVYDNGDKHLAVTPTSKFILRTSLGWLFEHPNIPEEYYSYRQNRKQLQLMNFRKVEVYVDKSVSDKLENNSLIITKVENKANNSMICDLEAVERSERTSIELYQFDRREDNLMKTMNPLLENILNAACPFLADFRVSVMPLRVEKSVSRSGRYRHITTKYSGAPTITGKQKSTSAQNKLLDAFLQTQTLSLRRTIEFIIERTTSAAVKDFQMTYLFPLKKIVADKVSSIEATDYKYIVQEMYNIYSTALREVTFKWDTEIPILLQRRIKEGFQALLPVETLEAVKVTCINLSMEKCLTKTNDWRITNMTGIELFCKDVQGEALKLQKSAGNKINVAPLKIDMNKIAPSSVFEKLQELLHNASMNRHEIAPESLSDFLGMVSDFLDEQDVPQMMNKTLAYMLLQLVIVLVINRCDVLTMDTTNNFIKLWKHDKLQEFTFPPPPASTPTSPADSELFGDENAEQSTYLRDYNEKYIFANLISNRFVRLLQHKDYDVIITLSTFINKLIENNLINIGILNEQFVKIFKEEWHQSILEKVSQLMDSVLKGNTCRKKFPPDTESQLFMEMLSDLARDMDDFDL